MINEKKLLFKLFLIIFEKKYTKNICKIIMYPKIQFFLNSNPCERICQSIVSIKKNFIVINNIAI